jgi:O-antigen ligase
VYVALERSIILGMAGLLFATLGLALWPSVVAASANNAVLSRLIGHGDASLSDRERLNNLDMALNRVNGHPLLGSGFSDLRLAHNTHLEVLVAVGVIGFTGWLLVLLALATPILRRDDPQHLLAYPAIFLVMVGSFEVVFETLHWAAISLTILAWPRPVERPT